MVYNLSRSSKIFLNLNIPASLSRQIHTLIIKINHITPKPSQDFSVSKKYTNMQTLNNQKPSGIFEQKLVNKVIIITLK